jgi:hypothetical protein
MANQAGEAVAKSEDEDGKIEMENLQGPRHPAADWLGSCARITMQTSNTSSLT